MESAGNEELGNAREGVEWMGMGKEEGVTGRGWGMKIIEGSEWNDE